MPVYLDPMTYAFGAYCDPDDGKTRTDLDWIKSEQKVGPRKNRKVVRRFKKSYLALAQRYGGLFQKALDQSKAISLEDLSEPTARRATVEAIINYQITRAKEEFEKDPEYAKWAEDIPAPPAVFAPYFYVEPNDPENWVTANLLLATEAVAAGKGLAPVHAILCLDHTFLADEKFINLLAEAIPNTGVAGVWVWFSKFKEDEATLGQLQTFRRLVEALAQRMEVFALHGGFFSLALSRVGLTGVSHGVGYGEQKDVMPVIGQSTPTVRYYAPPLRVRCGVVEIERSFGKLGINSPQDFFAKVCDCVICRSVIGDDLKNFASRFGAKHYSTSASVRQAQTPEAAKLCRFHFLLARFKERDWLKAATLEATKDALHEADTNWADLPAFQNDRPDHLRRWKSALS